MDLVPEPFLDGAGVLTVVGERCSVQAWRAKEIGC
jgi:hypothetical protein